MDRNWFPRLLAAIEADGRSKRKISLDAGLGPNFVQQMIANGKQPSADKLQNLLGALGYVRMFYVLTGIQVNEDDEDALKAFLDLPPHLRQRAKDLFLAIEGEGGE